MSTLFTAKNELINNFDVMFEQTNCHKKNNYINVGMGRGDFLAPPLKSPQNRQLRRLIRENEQLSFLKAWSRAKYVELKSDFPVR